MDAASSQLETLLTALATVWSGAIGLVGLTVARFLGLVMTAPLVSSPAVTWRLRISVAIVLGLCCGLAAGSSGIPIPAVDGIHLIWAGLVELAIGAAIGFSARLLLSGLELAGALIDQQAGLAGPLMSPFSDGQESAISSSGLMVTAGMVWLLLTPLGGDLRLIAALLDSLHALPPGTAIDPQSSVQLVRGLLSASCLFGLQVSAPFVLSLGLMQLVWGILARSRGGGLWQPAISPLRVLLTLLLLAATVTDLGSTLAARVDGWMHVTAESLTSVAPESRP